VGSYPTRSNFLSFGAEPSRVSTPNRCRHRRRSFSRRSSQKEGAVLISRSIFEANTAHFGGGVSLSRDLTLTMTDTAISRNTASLHAGGLELADCASATIARTT
jgi:hypothetical protein